MVYNGINLSLITHLLSHYNGEINISFYVILGSLTETERSEGLKLYIQKYLYEYYQQHFHRQHMYMFSENPLVITEI